MVDTCPHVAEGFSEIANVLLPSAASESPSVCGHVQKYLNWQAAAG